MKFRITLKDPDGIYDSIGEAAKESVKPLEGLTKEEKETLATDRASSLGKVASKWVEYGDYVVIEIDTDANTARVCEVKEL